MVFVGDVNVKRRDFLNKYHQFGYAYVKQHTDYTSQAIHKILNDQDCIRYLTELRQSDSKSQQLWNKLIKLLDDKSIKGADKAKIGLALADILAKYPDIKDDDQETRPSPPANILEQTINKSDEDSDERHR